MNSEDLYDKDGDLAEENEANETSAPAISDDFEVVLNRRAPKGDVFIQVFPRTRHWIRAGVRPEKIYREDKDLNGNYFAFEKTMKDPTFNIVNGVRYIKFRCQIALTELEIEISFSHIEIAYLDGSGQLGNFMQVKEGTQECGELENAFEIVLSNLAAYLSKVKN